MKRQLTGQETELVLTFVRECIPFAEEMIGPVYGPYMGGDPRNFEPDLRSLHRGTASDTGKRVRFGSAASGASRLASGMAGFATRPMTRVGNG